MIQGTKSRRTARGALRGRWLLLFGIIILEGLQVLPVGGFCTSSSFTACNSCPGNFNIGTGCKHTILSVEKASCLRQRRESSTRSPTMLCRKSSESGHGDPSSEPSVDWWSPMTNDPKRSFLFSILMSTCGAILGPFLDSYHSAFGVLQYNEPIQYILWGTSQYPALTTAWWVPALFGVAGFLIGWLYILLDATILLGKENGDSNNKALTTTPSPAKILLGISFFTLQYWLSGYLVQAGVDRMVILNLMSIFASIGFWVLDGTLSGLITSAATGVGGPMIEVVLIWCTNQGILAGGYHYTDLGETGFFPLWILPVYFLGGPANGNLARGFWNWLSATKESSVAHSASTTSTTRNQQDPCLVCNDTRCTPCPNCDGVGNYVAMGDRTVTCTSCNGRGFVICRACFDRYDDDPHDVDAIREKMSRMPD